MSIETEFNDEFSYPYSHHQCYLSLFMLKISSSFTSRKNRKGALQAKISINNRASLQYISDVSLLNLDGTHNLKFKFLSQNELLVKEGMWSEMEEQLDSLSPNLSL